MNPRQQITCKNTPSPTKETKTSQQWSHHPVTHISHPPSHRPSPKGPVRSRHHNHFGWHEYYLQNRYWFQAPNQASTNLSHTSTAFIPRFVVSGCQAADQWRDVLFREHHYSDIYIYIYIYAMKPPKKPWKRLVLGHLKTQVIYHKKTSKTVGFFRAHKQSRTNPFPGWSSHEQTPTVRRHYPTPKKTRPSRYLEDYRVSFWGHGMKLRGFIIFFIMKPISTSMKSPLWKIDCSKNPDPPPEISRRIDGSNFPSQSVMFDWFDINPKS